MKDKWFEGPWKIIKSNSLQDTPSLQPGEIMIHSSGNLVLNCPKCNAMQFVTSKIEGDTSPTLRGTVVCGGGHCKRCAFSFTIRGGLTVEVSANSTPKKNVEWKHLQGVKEPPRSL